jgi:chemotaxis protein MotB
MAGKGGGAWKVAYADFVTAMMAFFLVMWITAQSEEVKQAIAHHFNDPFAPESTESEDEDAHHPKPVKFAAPARPDNHEDQQEAGGGGRSLLLTSQGGDRTSIGMVIHFAEDSAQLDGAGRRRLEEFAAHVVGKPQRVEIRGHSTRRPLPAGSSFRDHWQLSYARCVVVMAALEDLGVERARMRLSQAAGNEPLSAPDGQLSGGGHARVEISLLNETAPPTVGEPLRSNSLKPPAKHAARRSRPAASHSPRATAAQAEGELAHASRAEPKDKGAEHAPSEHASGEP